MRPQNPGRSASGSSAALLTQSRGAGGLISSLSTTGKAVLVGLLSMLVVVSGLVFPSMASAAEITDESFTRVELANNGQTVYQGGLVRVNFEGKVPASATSGDTITLDLSSALKLASGTSLPIYTADNQLVGTGTSVNNGNGFRITFSDYVDTHNNIQFSGYFSAAAQVPDGVAEGESGRSDFEFIAPNGTKYPAWLIVVRGNVAPPTSVGQWVDFTRGDLGTQFPESALAWYSSTSIDPAAQDITFMPYRTVQSEGGGVGNLTESPVNGYRASTLTCDFSKYEFFQYTSETHLYGDAALEAYEPLSVPESSFSCDATTGKVTVKFPPKLPNTFYVMRTVTSVVDTDTTLLFDGSTMGTYPAYPNSWSYRTGSISRTLDGGSGSGSQNIVPLAPEFVPSNQCGVEGTVSLPEQEGVLFTPTREGNIVTVVATALEGYRLSSSAQTEWTFEIPEIEPCDIIIEPMAPRLVLSEQCGVEATVELPEVGPLSARTVMGEVAGARYTQTREGNIVTVVATPLEGYVFAEGAESEWTFEIPPVEPCDIEVDTVRPELVPADQCGVYGSYSVPGHNGVPAIEGLIYTIDSEALLEDGRKWMKISVTAAEGYVLAEGATTSWELNVPAPEDCPDPTPEVTPVAPEFVEADQCGVEGTVTTPEVEGVVYLQTREGNTITVTAEAIEGYVLAEGAQTVWTFEVPEVVPCDIEVPTVAPEFVESDQCGVEGIVITPETEGVRYTQTREGNIITVTAEALEGYVLEEGAVTEWTFEVPEVEPCDVEVETVAPVLTPADQCGVEDVVSIPETEGVIYTQTREGNIITVTAVAAEGYVLAEGAVTEWTFEIAEVEPCFTDAAPVAPTVVQAVCTVDGVAGDPTLTFAKTEGISYSIPSGAEIVAGGSVIVTAEALEGFKLAETEGWKLSENGFTATMTVTFDTLACEKPEEPQEPQKPVTPEEDGPKKGVVSGLAETGTNGMLQLVGLGLLLAGIGAGVVLMRRRAAKVGGVDTE